MPAALLLALGIASIALYLVTHEGLGAGSVVVANPRELVRTVTVTRTAPAPSPSSPVVAIARAPSSIPTANPSGPSAAQPFIAAGAGLAAPFAVEAPKQGLEKLSEALKPNYQGGGLPGQAQASDLAQKGADVIAPFSAIGGALGIFAAKSVGIRGKSEKEQAATFGKATLSTLETIEGYVPIAGPVLALATEFGAGTYEGKRAVKAAGVATEQGYTFQKKLFQGDVSGAFSGGGKSSAQRKGSFFFLVDQRVAALSQGGKISAQDAAGFQQAKAYGYTLSGGFDLSKLDLAVGTNPFHGG